MPASSIIPIDQPLTILAISADPTDAGRLRIDKERREVTQALNNTKLQDKYTWKYVPGDRIQDLTSALDEHNPNILYVTGHSEHGSYQGTSFVDEYGNAVPLSVDKLANLLKARSSVGLVYLVPCDSGAQAQAIADAVGHVIGLEVAGAAANESAISFSREFFTALGDGRSYETAFNRAKDAIALNQGCSLRPHFFKR